ncbi:MAG TPA: CvpA family protein [Chthoniobacterales bacterium]|jgi:uncharacterized membrane protein required for colicin V production
MTAGSSLWQIVFVSFAAFLILFEVVRGWRLGILRQLMRIAGVVAAYGAALFGGDLLLPLLRPILKMPDMIVSAIGGAVLAILVYALVGGLGTILFKRSAEHSNGTVRLAYGLGGALIGLLFGAFFICIVVISIRSVGSIAEAQVESRSKSVEIENRGSPAIHSRPPNESPPRANVNADSLMTALARLKHSVELGPVGAIAKKTDAIPTGVYQTVVETGTVLANPDSARKFLTYPGVAALSENPKIVALRNDPEIAEMIAQGRLFELLRDPRILDAANDPSLAESAKQFDLKKALEFAAKK